MCFEMEDSCQMEVDNSENVLKITKNFFRDKFMTDINLVVGNKEYVAHRLVLCGWSDVFLAMLSKPEWNECHETRVILQELPQCELIFENFLEYLYTGKIIITYNNVMAILALADKYFVKTLTRACLEYMSTHIPQAAAHNVLFSWLQYTMSCGHKEVALKSFNYVKWNLSAVANSPDFSDFDVELVINLLQQNDLIVYNEMVLYNFMVRWLDLQRIHLIQNGLSLKDVDKQMDYFVETIMSNIRFPMMNPKEIAELLLSPLVRKYKEFLVERMAIAMVFHSGQNDSSIDTIKESENGTLLFKPRLYISDCFSSILCIDNFRNLPSYHTSTFLFSSHITANDSDSDSDSDRISEWVVDLYPKGVWFEKCYLILWRGPIEIPEQIFSTVRLSLTCREVPQGDIKVRIGVLLYAKQGGIEFVIKAVEKVHYFNSQSRVLNLDNLIPFEELNPSFLNGKSVDTKYLIGPNNDQLKINVVITPMSSE